MWQFKQLLEVSVSASNTCGDICTCDIQWYLHSCAVFHVAIVCGMSIVPLNTTSVRVSWTPVNLTVLDHYTVHYTVGGVNGTVSFSATSSSGVVSELQGGQEYWFGVTVTLNVSGSRSPDYRLPPIACKHLTLHTCLPISLHYAVFASTTYVECISWKISYYYLQWH